MAWWPGRILAAHITNLPIETKNLITFCCSAILFPLAWSISKALGVDFEGKGNPLTKAGILFSVNQMLYILIAMWVFAAVPEKMLMVYAMIFGAHLMLFHGYTSPRAILYSLSSFRFCHLSSGFITRQLSWPLSWLRQRYFSPSYYTGNARPSRNKNSHFPMRGLKPSIMCNRGPRPVSEGHGSSLLRGGLRPGSSSRNSGYLPAERYSLNASTYFAKASWPSGVILQVVRGILPLNPFSTVMYPADVSFSICTLRFPEVAPVCFFR